MSLIEAFFKSTPWWYTSFEEIKLTPSVLIIPKHYFSFDSVFLKGSTNFKIL